MTLINEVALGQLDHRPDTSASIASKARRWSAKGVWWPIFEATSDDPDFEYLIVDFRHRPSASARRRGEWGLKIKLSGARAAA